MKRDCHEAVELLAQELRGSLSDADEATLQAHLSRCEACRAAAADQRRVEALMGQWPEMRAEDTAEAVAAVRTHVADARAARGVSPARVAAVVATAAMLVVGAFALASFVSRSPNPGSPGIASYVPWETVRATGTATANAAVHRAEQGPPAQDAQPMVARVPKPQPRRHHRATASRKPAVPSPQPGPPEEPQPPPDLAEFFALGPPPPGSTSPELLVEMEEVIAPDGSVMTAVAVTDVERGELIGHLVAPYDMAANWRPLAPPKDREPQPSQPGGAEMPQDGGRTGNLTLGGGLG